MLSRTVATVASVAAFTLVAGTSTRAATITTDPVIPLEGHHFALPVVVEAAVELTSWQFDLRYDPTDVQIDTDCDPFGDAYCNLLTGAVTEGAFFGAGAPFNVLNPGILLVDPVTQEQRGSLIAVQGLYAGGPPPPSGSGVLAYIRFRIVGSGDSSIVVLDGSVPTTVPEPAAALLVLLALPALARRRARSTPRHVHCVASTLTGYGKDV